MQCALPAVRYTGCRLNAARQTCVAITAHTQARLTRIHSAFCRRLQMQPPLYEDISDDETQPGSNGDFAIMVPPIAITAPSPIVVEKFSPAPSVNGSSYSSSSSSSATTSSSSASNGTASSGTVTKMTRLKSASVQEPVNTSVATSTITSCVNDTRSEEARSVWSITIGSITFTTPSSPPAERFTLKDRDERVHFRACAEKNMVLNIGGKQFLHVPPGVRTKDGSDLLPVTKTDRDV